jgi:hypothetical protein
MALVLEQTGDDLLERMNESPANAGLLRSDGGRGCDWFPRDLDLHGR